MVGLDITNMVAANIAFRMTELFNTAFELLVEFLTTNEEYQQAQRNIRAIASKVGVRIHGTQARSGGQDQ